MASENISNPQDHFLAGKRFLREENMDKSLRAFEKAFKEDKDNADYMSYYGMLKALRGGEIGLGLELCTRAIKKEFFKAEYYLNLGSFVTFNTVKKIAPIAENVQGSFSTT